MEVKYFKCENCNHYQLTTEFGECEECGYEDLVNVTQEEYEKGSKVEYQKLFQLRGIDIVECTPLRIKQADRKKDLHYYEIRHSDENWGEPVCIRHGILVNHFGTIAARTPLPLKKDDFGYEEIELTEDEAELIQQFV
ncbi:LPD28 domain-containing protein [Heyndrickxia camelliae]|uniref:Large polyvalent protein associated domain-containing protein n=1 Tax=Heyndrickxia camelliae TaxID=1707093 RepID=A0A2N3LD23_9BACI|nr:LPD28 domain-containing protein [Heyndrickxia camelliae]PKR82486.1 hypothetical protein CWO92_24090 [Heyndrickxia camelliae]